MTSQVYRVFWLEWSPGDLRLACFCGALMLFMGAWVLLRDQGFFTWLVTWGRSWLAPTEIQGNEIKPESLPPVGLDDTGTSSSLLRFERRRVNG